MKKWNINNISDLCFRENHENKVASTTKTGNTYYACRQCRSWLGLGRG